MYKKNLVIYSLLACLVSGTVMPIFAKGGQASPTAPEDESGIVIVDRKNGSFEQEVFFAGQDASYELQVTRADHGRNVASIIVRIGENKQEVPVEEGVAEFPIEPGQEGYMEILYG